MNRRITIFDQEDFKTNHLLWWSLPLGDEIYSVQTLESMAPTEREAVLNVGEGDGVLVASGNAWSMLRERYHFGIRNEGFVDCQQLTRLSIEGGAYLKCIPAQFPEDDVIQQFMSPDFTKEVDYGPFNGKVIKTIEDAHRFLGWLEQQPDDTYFGYDVESSGMALDRWFELSGLSICTIRYGGFISLTCIRHQVGKESKAYAELLTRIGAFLQSRMDHIWVYNMQYEYQVSFRMFNVDLYKLCDSSTINLLDGFHLNKVHSLKFASQRVLLVREWDSAFDRISELIDSMLYTEIGKTKAEREKVLKVTQENFCNTPEWAELCRLYPDYIDEFKQLIIEYWGNAFMPIPADILGKYCILDSRYTLLLFEARRNTYSEVAFKTFLNNVRLSCQLHSVGVNKWEEFRQEYEVYCNKMMAWGITYNSLARCWIKMKKHQAKMANISKYSPIARQLLQENNFYNGDPVAITKNLLFNNLDCFDCTETGLDEGKLALKYGDDFAGKLSDIVKDAMKEVKMKTKIDESIVRKKKILGIIAEKLIPLIGLDRIKINNKHIELEKYLYYERAYKELMKICDKQMTDINHIPDTIYFGGKKLTLLEYSDTISDQYFKCKSPIENDEICLELAQLFPTESAYLSAIKECVHFMKDEKGYYEKKGIKTVEEGFEHFKQEYTKVWNGTPADQTEYSEKVYNHFNDNYQATTKGKLTDSIKEIFSDFSGYEAQEMYFPYVKDQYLEYGKKFDPVDLDHNFPFLRKMVLNYLLYKKYSKLLSSYCCSLFTKNRIIEEDPYTHVMLREADKSELGVNPNVCVRLQSKYDCCLKSSKRWGAPWHTVPAKLDVKSVVIAFPGCLLSYFDIRNCVA